MSNIQYAFIERTRVPDRAELQASIDALGFDLKLHPEYTPFEDSGFLPFVLNAEEGPGFEIQYEAASDLIGAELALQDIAAGRDYCISMAWHGSMKDLACVLIVSCALIKDFDAVVSYEGEPPESLEKLLSEIPGVLAEAKADEAKAASRSIDATLKKPWWKLW
jgi:hypothetical protein